MFPQDPPANLDVAGRREPGGRPELLADVGRGRSSRRHRRGRPLSIGSAGLTGNAVTAKRKVRASSFGVMSMSSWNQGAR
jgi:hypothetical protein